MEDFLSAGIAEETILTDIQVDYDSFLGLGRGPDSIDYNALGPVAVHTSSYMENVQGLTAIALSRGRRSSLR